MSDPFLDKLESATKIDALPKRVGQILRSFYTNYQQSLALHGMKMEDYRDLFFTFLKLIQEQIRQPFLFEHYHEAIREPFNYHKFGLDLIKPLVEPTSSVLGVAYLQEILAHLAKNENVILFANHQTEADPQAMSILLEQYDRNLSEDMIFVAGERVTTDPFAIPFSMGCNLLCIYSKRYIDYPPEEKLKKQLHNKYTMGLMSKLLAAGGKSIYVAPSGGRDRRDSKGSIQPAPFDSQSIEMFYLMAKKSTIPTHFYPLALATYDLLPPPETVQVALGEDRIASRGAIHLAFGPKIDMENFPGHDMQDKHLRRQARADFIWNQVKNDYLHIGPSS